MPFSIFLPTGRQLDEDHIAQLFLGIGADADGGDIAVDLHPFMIFGKADAAHRGTLLCVLRRFNGSSRRPVKLTIAGQR